MPRTLLVVGASRGIGSEVARHFQAQGDHVLGVSRTQPDSGEWIQADISRREGIEKVVSSLSDLPLHALLFMGGIWEANAFTPNYSFEKSPHEETQSILNVNLVAPIEITKSLIDNLRQTGNPRAIYMGATSGLEQSDTREVAYSASKFGLRGAIHALRLELEEAGIGFTTINPGFVATAEVLEDMDRGELTDLAPIPMEDILRTIEWIVTTSCTVEIGDITLTQKAS